jgi:hypothetical protein
VKTALWIRIGVVNADPDLNQLLTSMRIRIKGAKPVLIHADPDPGQTFTSQKVEL